MRKEIFSDKNFWSKKHTNLSFHVVKRTDEVKASSERGTKSLIHQLYLLNYTMDNNFVHNATYTLLSTSVWLDKDYILQTRMNNGEMKRI